MENLKLSYEHIATDITALYTATLNYTSAVAFYITSSNAIND